MLIKHRPTYLSTCLALMVMSSAMHAQTLSAEKEKAEGYNILGLRQIAVGNYNEAIQTLNQAIQSNPLDPVPAYNLGTAYYLNAQYEKAITYLQRALALNQSYAAALNQIGVVYADMGQYDRAVDSFKRAIQQRPDAVHFYNLGCVSIRMRDFKTAVESLTQALHFQPDNAEALVNLAYAYTQQKDYSNAFFFVRKAVKLQPSLVEAEALLGFLYLVTKDRSSAIQQYQVLKNLDEGAAKELYAQIYRGRIVDADQSVAH